VRHRQRFDLNLLQRHRLRGEILCFSLHFFTFSSKGMAFGTFNYFLVDKQNESSIEVTFFCNNFKIQRIIFTLLVCLLSPRYTHPTTTTIVVVVMPRCHGGERSGGGRGKPHNPIIELVEQNFNLPSIASTYLGIIHTCRPLFSSMTPWNLR
jgi:hypothetical protein